MNDPRMIPADEARELLGTANLRGCDLEHFASYDPDGRYPTGARSLVYIDGFEDVDGLGNFQETGGPICDGVPEEVAPLFAAAPDLAYTVVEQAKTIQTLSRLLAGAKEAATERAAQIERVRAVLTDLRGQQEAALQRWDSTGDTWDGATSDTLHDTADALTRILEGDNNDDPE